MASTLTRMGAESIGEIENSDGEIDMAADGIGGFLGENAQEPALLEFPEEGVFDQAAQVIEVDMTFKGSSTGRLVRKTLAL